jgi:hypothetical protein
MNMGYYGHPGMEDEHLMYDLECDEEAQYLMDDESCDEECEECRLYYEQQMLQTN